MNFGIACHGSWEAETGGTSSGTGTPSPLISAASTSKERLPWIQVLATSSRNPLAPLPVWMGWQPQSTLAASCQTCKLALLVQFDSYQMKKKEKRITLWYSKMLTLSNLPSNPGSPNSTGFAMAPKSRHSESSPQPSLWPLSLVLSKARKGIWRSQVKARLASRVDFTIYYIYYIYNIYIWTTIRIYPDW